MHLNDTLHCTRLSGLELHILLIIYQSMQMYFEDPFHLFILKDICLSHRWYVYTMLITFMMPVSL